MEAGVRVISVSVEVWRWEVVRRMIWGNPLLARP